MKYDFDQVVNRRGTDSSKWNRNPDEHHLPMPVADMDFESAPAILDALHARVEHGVFGYADPPEWAEAAVCEKLWRDYQWEISPEWLVWLPGLVVGLNLMCRMMAPHEGVVTTTPIYPPFLSAPVFSGRELNKVPMLREAHSYGFDWDALESVFAQDRSRLFLNCNPHNPAGRVMRRDELECLGALCVKHDVLICSDEIHCDLVLDENLRHQPLAMIAPEIADRTVTLMSPSKAFNLAGMMCSFAVIPNDRLRRRFRQTARGLVTELNVFGFAALEAAYRHGAEWHTELLRVLRRNRNRVETTIAALPDVWMPHVEATYLAWFDMRRLFPGEASVAARINEFVNLGLSAGEMFGAPGFVRMNFGCPESTLAEGVKRLQTAVSRQRG